MSKCTSKGMIWKLRRVAAGFRQQDVAARAGMAATRYSAIERGELEPSPSDVEYIETALPSLPPELVAQILSTSPECAVVVPSPGG
jgi:transcriptional regulator with XRE-family HTH domain